MTLPCPEDSGVSRPSAVTESGPPSGHVGIIREITVSSARAVEEVPEWEPLELAVDSGASVTVIGEDQVRAVTATNARPDVKHEVADGSQIPNLGEKAFSAVTDNGLFRNMSAQVADVNKALLSVSRIVKAGNRVVFDSEGSYIEHKTTGEWEPLEEKGGIYTLKVWVPRDQSTPF